MKPTRALLLTSMAFFGASFLGAQDDFPGHDRNGDGVVTRSEWDGNMRTFRNHDTNRDGVLSGNELPYSLRRTDEYTRGADTQMHQQFSRLDRNGDDVLQRWEWRGDRAAFRRLDSDRDGALSWSEYAATMGEGPRMGVGEGTRARRAEDRAGDLDKNASGAVEGYEWPYNRELFHQLDTDANSVLTENELNNMTKATLNQLDTNRNGQIDRNEWPGGFAQFRELDEDGDGRVTATEYFGRGANWQRRQRFQEWDKNGDGIIQSTEWKTDNQLFHRLDTNANSQVEWEEFRADTGRYLEPRRW